MTTPYGKTFFERMDGWAVHSAQVLVPLVYKWLRPGSVVDVGGGTGGWANAFAEAGVEDYLCVDGPYVDRSALRVPPDHFFEADLCRPLDLGRRYDLAVCLEVAEHLPESAASALVSSLSRHADAVLFSAAIPSQGGTHHLNEQWPRYWAERFASHSYSCFDCLRWRVWSDPAVARWYKQNTLLYLNAAGMKKLGPNPEIAPSLTQSPISVVHPDVYFEVVKSLQVSNEAPSLPWALRAVVRSARGYVVRHSGQILRWGK